MSAQFLRRLRDQTTIRLQTAVLAVFLCVTSVGVAAFASAFVAREKSIASTNRELVAVAHAMASRLDQHMWERYRELKNIANLKPLQETWSGDGQAVRGILEQLQTTLPEYAWLGFATPDGTVKAATGGMLEGVSVAERPWFKAGLKGPAVQDVHDAKLLDKLLRTSPDQAPFRFVDVAMPVYNADGSLAGVLGSHLSWTWAEEVRRHVLNSQDVRLQSDIWILSKDGTVLLGPSDRSFTSEQRSGIGTFIDEQPGNPTLTALVSSQGLDDYPGLGWVVAARRPLSVAQSPANSLALQIVLIGCAVALAAAFPAWLVAGSVAKPLSGLASRLDAIGRDPEASNVERAHGSVDVLQLSSAVRSLLRRLGTAEANEREASTRAEEISRLAQDQARAAEEKTMRLGSDIRTLQVLADTDALTGLFNRRAFLPFADDALSYFRRYERDFGILMIDIDHFKQVNDTYGHAAGDDVIRDVAKVVLAQVRDTDKVARFGGEEFVILLREIDQEGMIVLANRIRMQISEQVAIAGNSAAGVNVSIGAAIASQSDRDVEDIIQRADKALYAAKTSGRNRVVAAESERPRLVA